MSMKTLADNAMLELNNRMELCTSSLEPSGDEILMAAMTCRIQELEEALLSIKNRQQVLTPSGFEFSSVWRIANKALKESEL